MDKDMEYCSFVSTHYIICECGDNFASEEDLKRHLDKGHPKSENNITETKPLTKASSFPNVINITGLKQIPFAVKKVIDANNRKYMFVKKETDFNDIVFKQDQESNEYILPESGEEPVELSIPAGVTEEVIELEYEDQETIVKTEPGITDTLVCRDVTFTEDLIKIEEVILDQENQEHDYDRELEKPVMQEFYFCEVCGKTFSSEKAVKLHSRMHMKAVNRSDLKGKLQTKKAVCDICGRNYASNAALRYHQRVHTGEKPFPCTECPKAFTMPLFLQIHMRTHTGERPYECHLCPKAFSSRAALLRHDRVHTGEKPYQCPQCLKSFSQSNSMKLHVQTVHLKMPTPYKSKSRKLKSLRRQQQLDSSESVFKSGGKRLKTTPKVEATISNTKIKFLEDQEYVVEEIPYEDDDVKSYVYEEVFIPMK